MANDQQNNEYKEAMIQQMREGYLWATANRPEAVQVAGKLMQDSYLSTTPAQNAQNAQAEQAAMNSNAAVLRQTLDAQRASMEYMQSQMQAAQAAAQNNQAALSAYHRMDPFSTAPVFNPNLTYQQQMQANNQLMSVNYMNPYIAQAVGGGQGFNGMMPGSQYSVAPRYGVYRNDMFGMGATAQAPNPGLWEDLLTMGAAPFGNIPGLRNMNFRRSMPFYEDPYDSTVRARERMYRRGESLTSGALSLGSMVGTSLMGTGPLGIAAGIAVGAGVDAVADMYFDRRAQAHRVQDATQNFITTGNDLGVLGRGISNRSSAGIVSEMRKYAAASPFFNNDDMENIMRSSAEAGTMNFVGNKEGIIRTMKSQAEMLRTFMKITGDADMKSVFERMSQFQSMGLATGTQNTMLQNIQAFGRMAGMDANQMLQAGAGVGGQQAVSLGAAPIMGMYTGAVSEGMVKMMQQQGMMNQLQMSIRGGSSGMMQNMSAAMLSSTHTDLARFLPALVKMGENGKLGIDQDAVKNFVSGNADFNSLVGKAQGNLNKYGNMVDYLQNRKDWLAEIESNMTPADQILAVRSRVRRVQEQIPGFTEAQAYQRLFGDQHIEMRHATGAQAMQEAQRQLNLQLQKQQTGDMRMVKDQDGFWNRMGTGVTSQWNSGVESVFGDSLLNAAEEEQQKAAASVGREYVPGQASIGGLQSAAWKEHIARTSGFSPSPNQMDRLRRTYMTKALMADSGLSGLFKGKDALEDARFQVAAFAGRSDQGGNQKIIEKSGLGNGTLVAIASSLAKESGSGEINGSALARVLKGNQEFQTKYNDLISKGDTAGAEALRNAVAGDALNTLESSGDAEHPLVKAVRKGAVTAAELNNRAGGVLVSDEQLRAKNTFETARDKLVDLVGEARTNAVKGNSGKFSTAGSGADRGTSRFNSAEVVGMFKEAPALANTLGSKTESQRQEEKAAVAEALQQYSEKDGAAPPALLTKLMKDRGLSDEQKSQAWGEIKKLKGRNLGGKSWKNVGALHVDFFGSTSQSKIGDMYEAALDSAEYSDKLAASKKAEEDSKPNIAIVLSKDNLALSNQSKALRQEMEKATAQEVAQHLPKGSLSRGMGTMVADIDNKIQESEIKTKLLLWLQNEINKQHLQGNV